MHVRAFLCSSRRPLQSLLSFCLCKRVSADQIRNSSKMPSVNSTNLVLRYTKVVPDAFPPTKGSVKAAGYDLKSAYDYVVKAHDKEIIDTGIKVQLPEGCYGRIAPRSGLAAKNFIDVGGNYCYLIKVYLKV